MFFKKKNKYPAEAKYKKNDYVNFRYSDELFFGYIYEAKVNEDKTISYTIQVAGQCPYFIKDYKEENIIGIKER